VVSRQVLVVEEELHQKTSVFSFSLLASAVAAVQEEVAAVVLPTLHYRLEKKAAVEVQNHLLLKACRAAAL